MQTARHSVYRDGSTSHALEQARVAAIDYTLGIFTNLTEDHLDYHGDMEHYFAAKARLFTQCKYALLNADDPAAKRMSSFYASWRGCTLLLCRGHA